MPRQFKAQRNNNNHNNNQREEAQKKRLKLTKRGLQLYKCIHSWASMRAPSSSSSYFRKNSNKYLKRKNIMKNRLTSRA